ncbi:hypothetical protein CsSME_00034914 [Camellia sinensis var. sinensis]
MELERVQVIASLSKCIDTIPAEYIRSENEQPAITTIQGKVLEVPVIDLNNDSDDQNIVQLVAEACRDWGIFQVVNHGIPDEVPGLQVFKDDHWYEVKYIPNALIVHIGDQIEIVSNGKYRAVFHRSTVNKETTRMSWPVFIEPSPEVEVGPHPKLIDDKNPPKYKTKKYEDYMYCKLNKLPQ